jgi:hypothetical protein
MLGEFLPHDAHQEQPASMDRNIEDLLGQIRDELRMQSKQTTEFREQVTRDQKIAMARQKRQIQVTMALCVIFGVVFGIMSGFMIAGGK